MKKMQWVWVCKHFLNQQSPRSHPKGKAGLLFALQVETEWYIPCARGDTGCGFCYTAQERYGTDNGHGGKGLVAQSIPRSVC